MDEPKWYSEINVPVLRNIEEKESDDDKVFHAAIAYATMGFYVVPLVPHQKKLPPAKMGVSYRHASKDVATVSNWFNPVTGKFKGYNIGLATGKYDGIFVVDVDRHGSVDGRAELVALQEKYGPLPPGPVQETPSGGYHHLFKWQEHATSSTNKLAEAIDTRGGVAEECKAHIVVWPSKVDGKEYQWISGGLLPDVPEWVMDKLGIPWAKSKAEGRGSEEASIDDFETVIPLEQVQEMLSRIDPDELSYDQWLRVGMSIKSQYVDKTGLGIWDEWSKQGDRYDPKECYLRWDGLSEFGAIRMGTLVYLAMQAGWEPQEDDVRFTKLHHKLEELNHTYAYVVIGGRGRIIRERTNRGSNEGHLPTYDLLHKEAFEMLLESKRIIIDPDTGKSMPLTKVWLASETRRTYPLGTGLYPEGAPIGVYNTWGGYTCAPREGDCSKFIGHIEEVICSGNKEESEWVLDWLADLIQNPSDPPGTCIVMRGGEGVGKGTLANLIGELYGSHYVHVTDDAHLQSQFNGYLADCLFLFADEVTWGGNKKGAGKLNGLVTEKHILLERKGFDSYSIRNLLRVMIASNNEWVIPAGTDSRRWYVAEVGRSRQGDFDYFGSIRHEWDNGGKGALLHYLMHRKITRNLRIAPHTQALQDQRDLTIENSGSISMWLMHVLATGEIMSAGYEQAEDEVGWPSKIPKKEMYVEYQTWCKGVGIRPHHANVFFKEMKKVGLDSRRERAGADGQRVYTISIPSRERLMDQVNAVYSLNIKDD